MVTRLDGVPPEHHAAVTALLHHMLGGHDSDLDLTEALSPVLAVGLPPTR